MDSLREFFASSSGLAPARRGLSLGWLISALTGITVLLGARGAEANACPTSRDCQFNNNCSIEDPSKPIRCCTTKKRPDGRGGCEVYYYHCECTT